MAQAITADPTFGRGMKQFGGTFATSSGWHNTARQGKGRRNPLSQALLVYGPPLPFEPLLLYPIRGYAFRNFHDNGRCNNTGDLPQSLPACYCHIPLPVMPCRLFRISSFMIVTLSYPDRVSSRIGNQFLVYFHRQNFAAFSP